MAFPITGDYNASDAYYLNQDYIINNGGKMIIKDNGVFLNKKITNYGTIQISNSGALTVNESGEIENHGSIIISDTDYGLDEHEGGLDNQGTITNKTTGNIILYYGNITLGEIYNSGTFNNNGNITMFSGTLHPQYDGGSFTNSGMIYWVNGYSSPDYDATVDGEVDRTNIINVNINETVNIYQKYGNSITNGDLITAANALQNADSTDSGSSNSGAVGDPYIVPLNGNDVWKMPNFQGFSRMLQGNLDGQMLTINVETTISSAQEAKESEEYTRAGLKQLGYNIDQAGPAFSITDRGEAFMRNLWIKLGDKSITVDMMKLKSSSSDVFEISSSTNHASFPKYDCHDAESISIKLCDSLNIIVSTYSNPQVRTGFSLSGDVSLIKKPSGVLCNKLYKKDMKLNKLKNTKALAQTKDRPPRGTKREQWVNTNGVSFIKTMPTY